MVSIVYAHSRSCDSHLLRQSSPAKVRIIVLFHVMLVQAAVTSKAGILCNICPLRRWRLPPVASTHMAAAVIALTAVFYSSHDPPTWSRPECVPVLAPVSLPHTFLSCCPSNDHMARFLCRLSASPTPCVFVLLCLRVSASWCMRFSSKRCCVHACEIPPLTCGHRAVTQFHDSSERPLTLHSCVRSSCAASAP